MRGGKASSRGSANGDEAQSLIVAVVDRNNSVRTKLQRVINVISESTT